MNIFLKKANEFAEELKKNNFKCTIEQITQYQIKISINNWGFINLWYSPKKNTFKLTFNELKNKDAENIISQLWNKFEKKDFDKKNKLEGIHIFIDGGFKNNKIYYGFLVVKDNEIIKKERFEFDGEEEKDKLNVTGEIKAAEKALLWAKNENIDKVTLHYDYIGLEKWAKNIWKANTRITKEYKKFIQSLNIKIIWNKIKSHSGNRYNEMIDEYIKKIS